MQRTLFVRRTHYAFAAGLVGLGLAGPTARAAGDAVPTFRLSVVSTAAGDDDKSERANGFAPFVKTVSSSGSTANGSGTARAAQDSTVELDSGNVNLLKFSGTASVNAGATAAANRANSSSASSTFLLRFDVARAGYDYDLTLADTASASGGSVSVDFASTTVPSAAHYGRSRRGATLVENGSRSGALPAGSYQFELRSNAFPQAGGGGTAQQDSSADWAFTLKAPIFWDDAVSGRFSDGTKWTGGRPPSGSDNATIDKVGTYTIGLDRPVSHHRLHVNGAGVNPEIELNGNRYQLDELVLGGMPGDRVRFSASVGGPVSVTAGPALSGGRVRAQASGEIDALSVKVDSGATFSPATPVVIPSILIDHTGVATAAGPDAVWQLDHVVAGGDDDGTVNITGGASIQNRFLTLGRDKGTLGFFRGDGQATVSGANSLLDGRFIDVGLDGTGQLNVRGDAAATAHDVSVGAHVDGVGRVTIDGANSRMDIVDAGFGRVRIGAEGTGEITATNGGFLNADLIVLGDETGSDGTLDVNGGFVRAIDLLVGGRGKGVVNLRNPGVVEVARRAAIGVRGDVTASDGGQFRVLSDVIVDGGLGVTPTGAVLVGTASRLKMGSIIVGTGGLITGTGTLFGNLQLQNPAGLAGFGGTLAPAHSPGTITVDGSLEQEPLTLIEIEMAGTGAGQFDIVHVTKDAAVAGDLRLAFLDGFAPRTGDRFPFLQVDGALTGSFQNVEVRNLAPGFQFDLRLENGRYTMVALNDGVAVPEPRAAVALLVAGTLVPRQTGAAIRAAVGRIRTNTGPQNEIPGRSW